MSLISSRSNTSVQFFFIFKFILQKKHFKLLLYVVVIQTKTPRRTFKLLHILFLRFFILVSFYKYININLKKNGEKKTDVFQFYLL